MNPFRKLWNFADGLTEGLFDKAEQFVVLTKVFDSETKVHGFYRRLAADGKTEKGFGFYCPVRGGSDPAKTLNAGAYMRHCGRTDVLDVNALLPTVRLKPRRGRYRINEAGLQVIPTDAMDGFNGECEYETSKPEFL